MSNQKPVTLRFDPDVWRDLKAMSRASEVPIARIVNTAIKRHLATLIANMNNEQRAAFVAAGGVLPT